MGYVEGQNVAIEFRWGNSQYDHLPELAADLVRRRVAVLVAGDGPSSPVAKAATAAIPVIFNTASNPVAPAWSQASIALERMSPGSPSSV